MLCLFGNETTVEIVKCAHCFAKTTGQYRTIFIARIPINIDDIKDRFLGELLCMSKFLTLTHRLYSLFFDLGQKEST